MFGKCDSVSKRGEGVLTLLPQARVLRLAKQLPPSLGVLQGLQASASLNPSWAVASYSRSFPRGLIWSPDTGALLLLLIFASGPRAAEGS